MTIPESESMVESGVGEFLRGEERRILTELTNEAEAHLKEGNSYFVISNRWYRSWQRYVGQLTEELPSEESSEVSRPGPIDNYDIIESESDVNDPQLRKKLEVGIDYVLVPQEVWRKLVEWYKGGPPIQRKIICEGFCSKSYIVEIYLLCLYMNDSRDHSRTIIRLSRQASISQLYEMVCVVSGVAKEKAQIWDYYSKQKLQLLDPLSDQSLEEFGLHIEQDILLEVDMSSAGKESDFLPVDLLTWSDCMSNMIAGETSSHVHSNSSSYRRNTYEDDVLSASEKRESRGLVGLENLGNTCFMNSALQCLAHTPPIVEYFLEDYSEDINADNPLGMRGELAIAFGKLLRKLWSSGQITVAVAPCIFKTKLAGFASQFSGYNQHDSQEMLAFLLDGLHEDLNKIKQKPYIEAKDSEGRPDDEVAEERWKYHKARNDSVIVDVFQGQYKSTLVCPDCGKVSITFDPFSYLSLPLPSRCTRSMTVAVFYGDGSCLWRPYTVTVPKNATCRDLSNALGSACCLNNGESLLLAEVYEHKVFKYFENPLDSLTAVKESENIVAYRFTHRQKGTGKVKLEILHVEQQQKSDSGRDLKIFGTPLVTYIDGEQLCGTDIEGVIHGLFSSIVHDKNADGTPKSLSSRDTETDQEETAVGNRECFSLFSSDYHGLSLKPLDSDSVVNPGCITRVAVKWGEKEHEKYDSRYLNDLPHVVHNIKISLMKARQEEGICFFSCLEAFLAEEPLGPDDMWYCPSCKKHRQAKKKKLDLWKLPDILVIHLKRFTFNNNILRKKKIDAFVNFPIHNLDLSEYVKNKKDDESYLYELYAISNHYSDKGGGHYTAYAKLMDENKWYHFDDRHVSGVNEADIKTYGAYVLFYQRVRSESETSTKFAAHWSHAI